MGRITMTPPYGYGFLHCSFVLLIHPSSSASTINKGPLLLFLQLVDASKIDCKLPSVSDRRETIEFDSAESQSVLVTSAKIPL